MTADKSSNRIVNSILNDIVNKLPLSSETVPHDGSKGNRKTIDEWQIAYPWIELTDCGEKQRKCTVCKKG